MVLRFNFPNRQPLATASRPTPLAPCREGGMSAVPDDMQLPAGVTCGDCIHIARCKAMFGHVEADTYCDWSPSRFQSRNPIPITADTMNERN